VKLHLSLLLVFLVVGCMAQKPPPSQPQDWEYQTDGSIVTPPVLKEGRLYVFSLDGYLYCFDAMNGKIIWKTETEVKYVENYEESLTVGREVIILEEYEKLHAFDLITGRKLWESSLGESTYSIAVEDSIYYVSDKALIRLNERSGDIIWKVESSDFSFFQAPLIHGNKLLVGKTNGVECYSKRGELLWRFSQDTGYAPGIYDAEDSAIVLMEKLFCVDIETGKLNWTLEEPDWGTLHAPILTRESIIIGSGKDLMKMNQKTGEIIWKKFVGESFFDEIYGVLGDGLFLWDESGWRFESSFNYPRTISILRESDGEIVFDVEDSTLISDFDEEKVIFSTGKGLMCFKIQTGELVWQHAEDLYIFTGLLVNNGRLYVTSDNGKVYGSSIDNGFPFKRHERKVDYSEEFGNISQMNIDYRYSYDFGRLEGNIKIVLEDNSYKLINGSEEGCGDFDSIKNFEKEIIKNEIMTDFLNSLTDLYIDPGFDETTSTSWVQISIEIQLENGEWILIESGYDSASLLPWKIRFRDCQAVQFSGKTTLAFKRLMDEINWCYKGGSSFGYLKIVTNGYCEQPLTLPEICKSPKRIKMIV
jgi:outer membrane protein assembly factor BamB